MRCGTWRPISTAVTAAETGHLVFGTLHTKSSCGHCGPHRGRVSSRAAGAGPHPAGGGAGMCHQPDPAAPDRRGTGGGPLRSWWATPPCAISSARTSRIQLISVHADRARPGHAAAGRRPGRAGALREISALDAAEQATDPEAFRAALFG
ncbi:MAG: hypothetical protein ACLUNZ_07415 [Evtepia sp.]